MPPYNISYNIRQLRHKKGWNQEQVANQLDISIPAYSKIESGITDINLSRLEQIAVVYNISLVELLSDSAPVNREEVDLLKAKLIKRDQEVIDLQKEIIEFYKKE